MAELPVAAIVCIAVGCYVLLIIGLVALCYFLKGRGVCTENTCCKKQDGAQTCQCCVALSETCDCCHGPSLNSCLNSCCPNKKQISCVDIILCQCCSTAGGPSCCDCCKVKPRDTCYCCCLEVRWISPRDKNPTAVLQTVTEHGLKNSQAPPKIPQFRSISTISDNFSTEDLRLHGDSQIPLVRYPLSACRRGGKGGRRERGDFISSSSKQSLPGQSQLFVRPSVDSAGRAMVKPHTDPHWPWHHQKWSPQQRGSRQVSSLTLQHHDHYLLKDGQTHRSHSSVQRRWSRHGSLLITGNRDSRQSRADSVVLGQSDQKSPPQASPEMLAVWPLPVASMSMDTL